MILELDREKCIRKIRKTLARNLTPNHKLEVIRKAISDIGSCDCTNGMCCTAEHIVGYECTRPVGHVGEHVACATNEHRIKVWN